MAQSCIILEGCVDLLRETKYGHELDIYLCY